MKELKEQLNQARKIKIKTASHRLKFPSEVSEFISHTSIPKSETYEEWGRVRQSFVNNGLSDGVLLYEFPDTSSFSYTARGPNGGPKFSKAYSDCLGIVAVGTSKETGKEISFMTHSAPQKMLGDPSFKNWLKELCQGFKELVRLESVEVQIFGGRQGIPQSSHQKLISDLGSPSSDRFTEKLRRYIPEPDLITDIIGLADAGSPDFLSPYFERLQLNYAKSLSIIQSVIEEELNIKPEVDEPLRENGSIDAYFNTEDRQLYIIRPEAIQEKTTDHIFKLSGNVEKQIKSALGD